MMDLKKVFIVGTAGFVVICFGLFYLLTNSVPLKVSNSGQRGFLDLEEIESKLKVLEEEVISHRHSMQKLEKLALNNEEIKEPNKLNLDVDHDFDPINKVIDEPNIIHDNIDNDISHFNKLRQCPAFVSRSKAHSDINMLEAYKQISFDNLDGGVWKQGWKIDIDNNRFDSNNILKVFVIPHSHNDPGWIKTFERYYQEQTKSILDSMLVGLQEYPESKFIWAEISYFNMWWNDINTEQKNIVKSLIENKRLEFVTGGWVMPDEANSHYYSIITQLIEGNQWLLHHLNYKPKNGWSIDPFGMSPTMAYILKRTGIQNMLIQRTHYSVKKYLAKQQNLEYFWRQDWDSTGSSDIFCHMMPFYSYDVPHTCGPDPKVCCQFDFKRMRGVSSMNCPWNIQPQAIHTKNLKSKALLLLDQYKKKAMLFKTNTLLIPLGDDFRWEDKKEWDAQIKNYQAIFDYINSDKRNLFSEVKFGTLEDYFTSVNEEISNKHFNPITLSGDFFTYADRDDHYWSGYFVSRPFHKATDRQLIANLRSAHIIYSIMTAELSKKYDSLEKFAFVKNLLGKLRNSRRELSLFQHHDGVTGTSKDFVMSDYLKRLADGISDTNFVMQQSMHILNNLNSPDFFPQSIAPNEQLLEPSLIKEQPQSLEMNKLIILDSSRRRKIISVFNPDGQTRIKLVEVHVSTYNIKVLDLDENEIDFEFLPVFESRTQISSNIFQLTFVATIEPLATKNFIVEFAPNSGQFVKKPKILLKNSPSPIINGNFFTINEMERNDKIEISNEKIKINFNTNGLIESVNMDGKEISLSISMHKYGARKGPKETSGLYLFLPDGKAQELPIFQPFVKVIKGKFKSYVEMWLKQIHHRITLYNHNGFEKNSIEISNLVDIREESNFELMMKIKTNINSNDVFYSDLNGFQMIERKRFLDKLPLQAHYFPFPSAAYIEDEEKRLTLLTKQPLGVASLESGEIEVILDRRLMQDDNRGAGQGCMDNLRTINAFKIVLENRVCNEAEVNTSPMLSLSAHFTLHDFLHPFHTFTFPLSEEEDNIGSMVDYKLSNNIASQFPCDVILLDTHPLSFYKDSLDDNSFYPKPETTLLLHRVGHDPSWLDQKLFTQCTLERDKVGRFVLNNVFGDLFQEKFNQMTLTFIHEGKTLMKNETVLMKPMEIYAFILQYQKNLSN